VTRLYSERWLDIFRTCLLLKTYQ